MVLICGTPGVPQSLFHQVDVNNQLENLCSVNLKAGAT